MTTARSFSEAEWLDLNHLLSGGDLSSSTKKQLETYAVMLSRPRAIERVAGTSNFVAACDMVRTLLIVRMSEEQNEQAKRESRIALIISCVALLASIVQASVGIYQLQSDKPTLVKANIPLPVVIQQHNGIATPNQTREQSSTSPQISVTPTQGTRTPVQSAPQSSAASTGASK